jgi:hypothetical protein
MVRVLQSTLCRTLTIYLPKLKGQQMGTTELSAEMKKCMDLCLDCHALCTETASHVLHGDVEHSEGKHLVTLLDCAQICLAHADFMARGSKHHPELAKLCADICRACSQLCDQHADADGKMKECADICRKCEESCRRMASDSAESGESALAASSAPQGTGAIATPTEASGEGNIPVQGTGAGVTQFQ